MNNFTWSIINVAVGYVLAVATQVIVFPMFDMEITIKDNLGIAAIFTVVAIGRNWAVFYIKERFES